MSKANAVSKFIDIRSIAKRVLAGGPVYHSCLVLLALFLVAGILAGIHAQYIVGPRHSYGTYREIPLAILISTYIFFVVASTGLCLVSSIGHVFGVDDFMPIAKRAVFLSIITILAGFLVIGLEIENPIRMVIYSLISPNFTSNIWWMGTLYSFYVVFMSIEFIFLLLQQHKVAATVGLLGVISGVAAHSNLGGIFAMIHGREFWYGPYLPIYFIASALMTGCAFIVFFVILAHKINGQTIDAASERALEVIGNLTILMVAVIMFFTVWKVLTTAVGGPSKLEAMSALINGPYSFNFWVFEIIGGMIIPFVLFYLSKGKKLIYMFVASAIMIISIFFMRLDLVVVGQIVPLYMDLGVKEFPQLHVYSPSLHEILVVLGGFGFFGIAFLLGEKIFDGFHGASTGHGHETQQIIIDIEKAEQVS
ncbi:MAG: NrfD/PsrC family molybdoenzyme membrane anchor subunit [Syntrophales bacterium]|jgi:molybdopterin-containing oxidoreductase family membrane subunit